MGLWSGYETIQLHSGICQDELLSEQQTLLHLYLSIRSNYQVFKFFMIFEDDLEKLPLEHRHGLSFFRNTFPLLEHLNLTGKELDEVKQATLGRLISLALTDPPIYQPRILIGSPIFNFCPSAIGTLIRVSSSTSWNAATTRSKTYHFTLVARQ